MRRNARDVAFKIIYSGMYNDGDSSPLFSELAKEAALTEEEREYALKIIAAVDGNKPALDTAIGELAAKARYRLDRIYPTDLCALYIGMAEMTYTGTPSIVAIDEAVNLCSKYSTKESSSFVNGIFAAYKNKLDEKPE